MGPQPASVRLGRGRRRLTSALLSTLLLLLLPRPASALTVGGVAMTPRLHDDTNETPDPTWQLWAGLAPGLRLRTTEPAIGGWIGGVRRISGRLHGELDLGTGIAARTGETASGLRLGLRYEPRFGPFAPHGWLAFAHQHETTWADTKAAPIATIVGLSENGTHHRTGAEVGLGATLALGGTREGAAFQLGGRLVLAALLGSGPPLSSSLIGWVGSTWN